MGPRIPACCSVLNDGTSGALPTGGFRACKAAQAAARADGPTAAQQKLRAPSPAVPYQIMSGGSGP